jgi:beta-glucosidase
MSARSEVTDPVCPPGTAFAGAVDAVRGGRRTVDEAAAALRAKLTDDELLWLLDGDLTLIRGSREMSAHYNGVPFEGGLRRRPSSAARARCRS